MDSNYNHVLYHSMYSVCSVMVRLSYVLRGIASDPRKEILIREEHIDIGKKEQLTEHFLCDVNGYGEVPVLVPLNGRPIPDSLDITLHLAEIYPALSPAPFSARIKYFLGKLHDVNFFSVSFPGKPQSPLDSIRTLEERLGDDISERYRVAIDVKIKRVEKEKLAAVSENEVEDNVKRTREILNELLDTLKASQTEWCFGLSQPSALDAHLLVFIARLQDVKQDHLIPDELTVWANKFMQRDEWKDLMQDRRTLPPPLLASFRK